MDLAILWDFSDPALSEGRFRGLLADATPGDQFILMTQIARTYGLRRDFSRAQETLAELTPRVEVASPEAQARYHLECGRTFCSATHPPASQTEDAKARARSHWSKAIDAARAAGLDGLVIDAIHMMAFLDAEPVDQLRWGQEALEIAERSDQPAARRWRASLRNNIGYALHQMGRLSEALTEFEAALELRREMGNPAHVRQAEWMIAWTYRGKGWVRDALEIQLRLAEEWESAGQPSKHVFEELVALYESLGDAAKAAAYRARLFALPAI